jgi:hypothetical protein
MGSRSLAAGTWLVGAVLGVGTSVAFRVDLQLAVTLVLGVLAAALGIALLARRGANVGPWDVLLGAAWVVCYLILTVSQLGDREALLTDVALLLIGGAGLFLALTRRPMS